MGLTEVTTTHPPPPTVSMLTACTG